MSTITDLTTPIFPTSHEFGTLFAGEFEVPLKHAVPIFSHAEWQLFGGNSLTQAYSNDSIYGMWVDENAAKNPSLKFRDVTVRDYYDYDGYILMMDSLFDVSQLGAADKLVACMQFTLDENKLSCAVFSNDDPEFFTSHYATTPDSCFNEAKSNIAPDFAAADPSLWDEIECNATPRKKDGTLGCWGQ